MYTNISLKLQVSLILYIASAIALYLSTIDSSALAHGALQPLALALTAVGLWLCRPREHQLNRKIADIYQEYRSGNSKPSTWLQKVCTILGMVMAMVCTVTIIYR